LAKLKNFKDEKETIAIANTSGHRNGRLSSCCPWLGDKGV